MLGAVGSLRSTTATLRCVLRQSLVLSVIIALVDSVLVVLPTLGVLIVESGYSTTRSALHARMENYPSRLSLFLSSVDAGINEEIFYHLRLALLERRH